jgi:hypothetical protein
VRHGAGYGVHPVIGTATDEFDNERVLATLERMFTSAPRISLVVVQTSSGEPPSQSAD